MQCQTSCIEPTWGGHEHRVDHTTEELDALLDGIDVEARRSGRPQIVQLFAGSDSDTLGIVVGHDRSVLNHVPSDANPPYRTSHGGCDEDRPFTFYVAGDHHSETHWRHTIPARAAREAARVFLLTGRLDDRVEWEEV